MQDWRNIGLGGWRREGMQDRRDARWWDAEHKGCRRGEMDEKKRRDAVKKGAGKGEAGNEKCRE